MSILKEIAVDLNSLWKAASKPRHGQIFEKRQLSRLAWHMVGIYARGKNLLSNNTPMIYMMA